MIAHTDVYMENLRSMRTLSDLRSKCTDLMLNVPQPIDSTDVTSCVPNKKKAKLMSWGGPFGKENKGHKR